MRSCESLRVTSTEVCKLGIFFIANESCWSKKDQNWFYVRRRVVNGSTFGQSLFSRPFLQDDGFVDPKTDREIPRNELLKVS